VDRSFVEISRQKLVENFEAVRRTVGSAVEVLAVVKADAYGHGAAEVARTLEGAGARWFGVTSIEEAIELRRAGIRARILVLAEAARDQYDALAEFDLAIIVHGLDQLAEISAWARGRSVSPAVHLKFDSGMGRLGIEEAHAARAAALLAEASHLRFEGLATHLASAEDLGGGQTEEQLRRFAQVVDCFVSRGLRPPLIHMANSAALAYWPRSWGTMVRPGLALYGYLMPARARPAPQHPPLRLEPVLTWKARVLVVKQYPAGAPLGYNASFRTERPMRIGVIAAGYADGLDRRLSNGGEVLAGGVRTRIMGLVSMDVSLVDLSAAPAVIPGDYVTLLGQEGAEALDACDLAARCNTIPYEMLCGIGRRVRRIYM
jgi:alanine racemase